MDYVAGFLFSTDYHFVLLIQKEKPEWQKGKLNAIGGKIEPGEYPADAMRREFLEETGVDIPNWKNYTSLFGDNFTVHFYYAVAPFVELMKAKTMTDEQVTMLALEGMEHWVCIPNLRWLIPMALSVAKGNESAAAFQVFELKEEANYGAV